ncbi:hypothetical protein ACFE04_009132 [Oxalis oulophora]
MVRVPWLIRGAVCGSSRSLAVKKGFINRSVRLVVIPTSLVPHVTTSLIPALSRHLYVTASTSESSPASSKLVMPSRTASVPASPSRHRLCPMTVPDLGSSSNGILDPVFSVVLQSRTNKKGETGGPSTSVYPGAKR